MGMFEDSMHLMASEFGNDDPQAEAESDRRYAERKQLDAENSFGKKVMGGFAKGWANTSSQFMQQQQRAVEMGNRDMFANGGRRLPAQPTAKNTPQNDMEYD